MCQPVLLTPRDHHGCAEPVAVRSDEPAGAVDEEEASEQVNY